MASSTGHRSVAVGLWRKLRRRRGHVVDVTLGCGVAKAGGDDDVGLWRKLQRIVVVGCSDGWCWLRVCGAGDADLQR